jgi:hypothetical protein
MDALEARPGAGATICHPLAGFNSCLLSLSALKGWGMHESHAQIRTQSPATEPNLLMHMFILLSIPLQQR